MSLAREREAVDAGNGEIVPAGVSFVSRQRSRRIPRNVLFPGPPWIDFLRCAGFADRTDERASPAGAPHAERPRDPPPRCPQPSRQDRRLLALPEMCLGSHPGHRQCKLGGHPGSGRRALPDVEVLEPGGNAGYGRANNSGFRATPAAFALVRNPDVRITADVMENRLDGMDRSRAVRRWYGAEALQRVEKERLGRLVRSTAFDVRLRLGLQAPAVEVPQDDGDRFRSFKGPRRTREPPRGCGPYSDEARCRTSGFMLRGRPRPMENDWKGAKWRGESERKPREVW